MLQLDMVEVEVEPHIVMHVDEFDEADINELLSYVIRQMEVNEFTQLQVEMNVMYVTDIVYISSHQLEHLKLLVNFYTIYHYTMQTLTIKID